MPTDNEHNTVVKKWEIPIPPELDLDCGISTRKDGEAYVMEFTGTDLDLCVLAVQMLRIAGATNITNIMVGESDG
jgi:hypothetical protein